MRHSGYKVLVEEDTDRILGAQSLGPHSEEVINLFTMAIQFDLRADDLKRVRYTYPSHSDDISTMV